MRRFKLLIFKESIYAPTPIEMVADGLGAKILLGCVPGQAGSMLETKPMLDAQKGFLDIPSRMPL
ncbi:hypothetical protein [Candidatus Accumulibacter contiguus]|jgi:hypothetical protein|uniref:hypothetical protein n=1 Tax=Candidatus Accumulibacter contiguus TaxID=2954381 RepID=UPI0038CC158D